MVQPTPANLIQVAVFGYTITQKISKSVPINFPEKSSESFPKFPKKRYGN
jgi:hypothetical protein